MSKRTICVLLIVLWLFPIRIQAASIHIGEERSIIVMKDWLFYEQALLTATGVGGEAVTIPHRWGNIFGGKNGYGTYVTTLSFDEQLMGEPYALHIPYTVASYKLFFNGKEQMSLGQVGTSFETYKPEQRVRTHYFTIEQTEIIVALQIANYSNMVGGAERPITIGPRDAINHDYQTHTNEKNFILGGFLFMSVNVLSLYYFRREDASYLWVGLMGILLSLWYVLTNDHLVMDAFPHFSWAWLTRLETIMVYTAFSCYMQYLNSAYQAYFNKLFAKASRWSSLVLIAIAFVLPIQWLVHVYNFSAVLIVLFSMYVGYLSFCSIRDSQPYAKAKSVFNAAFCLATIQDLLFIQGFLNTFSYSIYGFILFTIGYFITLNHQHIKKYQESARLNIELQQVNAGLEGRIAERTKALRAKNDQLERLTFQDGLTNIPNRRYFDQQLLYALKQVRLTGKTCSLILFDIDFFKKYNDHYGHIGGDEVLKRVAKIATTCVGEEGRIARYGGEEFAVILLNKTITEAESIAQFLREAIVAEQIEHQQSEPYGMITISLGVAQAQRGGMEVNAFIQKADEALYKAKQGGRNRVCCAIAHGRGQ